ncbi:MAG: hypothetical protein WKF70_10475 [Chitinophagaceae bacterium]
MINASEFRLGNYMLQKVAAKISTVQCSYLHFELMMKEGLLHFFPLQLKPELLEKCGFKENKDYPLLPQAREFKLALPVSGNGANEIFAYVKNNGECFGRAVLNAVPISNNFFHLHSLQNLYFALTGKELKTLL